MDIKVGEYIRTNKGQFYKIKTINKYGIAIMYENKEDKISSSINYYTETGFEINEENIRKHSKNIIDLIEVGDFVNGILVTGKESTLLYTEIKGIDGSGCYIPISQYGEGIETILTHEQYEQNCYKLDTKQ